MTDKTEHTHFRKVYCSDYMPKERGEYLTDRGTLYCDTEREFFVVGHITWWLEPYDPTEDLGRAWQRGFDEGLIYGESMRNTRHNNPYLQQTEDFDLEGHMPNPTNH